MRESRIQSLRIVVLFIRLARENTEGLRMALAYRTPTYETGLIVTPLHQPRPNLFRIEK